MRISDWSSDVCSSDLFALILFVLLVVTGIVWCLDFFHLRARRRASGVAAMAATGPAVAGLGQAEAARMRQEAYDNANRAPWWIEYCVSFFPVILFVFVLRSFIVEPFRIPSGSGRTRVVSGKRVTVRLDFGGRLIIKKQHSAAHEHI